MLASLTSTISFNEVLTAYFAEEFKLSRRAAAITTMGLSVALSVLTFSKLFGVDYLDVFDKLTANVMMPLGAMFTCVLVGWFLERGFMKSELTNNETVNRYIAPVVIFMLRYITPLLIFYIFIMNLI
jgi:NSS family neurotransmitter:Na+ symporter